MKLNLNNNINKQNINNSNNNNIIEKERQELYKEFIDDVQDSSMELELTQENIDETYKRFKRLKFRKLLILISFIAFIVIICICAIFKTFFNRNYTGEEIAYYANYYNGLSKFPKYGVEGYLKSNLNTLFTNKLLLNGGTKNLKVSDPVVTEIVDKNDYYSNIYFYLVLYSEKGKNNDDEVLVESDDKESDKNKKLNKNKNNNDNTEDLINNIKINCMISLYYDYKNDEYKPAGNVIITPSTSTDYSSETKDNEIFSFEDIELASDEDVESCQTFVDNFLLMMYNGQDVSPYYDGSKLDIKENEITYCGIDDFALYSSPNLVGYNAFCTVNIITANGLSYKTDMYLNIEKTDKSWIIHNVL